MNESRLFLSTVLSSGIDCGMVSAEDIVKHVTMDVLAHHLPVLHKTKLLDAALKAEAMSAQLVLDTLGVEVIAAHAPTDVLWASVRDCAQRSLGGPEASKASAVPKEEGVRSSGGVSASGPIKSRGPASSDVPTPRAPDDGLGPRKPNRPARAVRAGATSRPSPRPPKAVTEPPPEDPSAFDIDTRVGSDVSEFDILEETSDSDDLLSRK